MVLRVEFEHFVESARRVLDNPIVAITSDRMGSRITATDKSGSHIVSSSSSHPVKKVEADLRKAGFEVILGEWTETDSKTDNENFSVAAVAYKSHESMPGLWIEAYSEAPSRATVLREIYDEFCGTGELQGTTLEEFLENTHPNVVVLSPDQIRRFLESRSKRK
jgi:hypothetical protein